MKFYYTVLIIVLNFNLLLGQNSDRPEFENMMPRQTEELLISQMDSEGKLDTFDFFDIVYGVDTLHSFYDQHGNEVNHLSFKNKVVLVDFWFLKCKPCIVELPGLDLLNKRINSEAFEIITFANDPMEEIEEKLLSKKKFNFKIVPQVFLVTNKSYPLKILLNKKSEVVDLVNYGNLSQRSINILLDKYTPLVKKELNRF